MTFDGLLYFMAEERIIVYEQIVLSQAKPRYFYTEATAGEHFVYVYGENFWNTEASGQLLCRSDTGATYPAYFIKVSLVLCKVPKRSTPGINYLEVTIDSVRYSIN